jgi:hypothetical protein
MTTLRLSPGVVLTTDSSASSYGAPAMRFNSHPGTWRDLDEWPDMGPSDVTPSGITAAEVACRAIGQADSETLTAIRRFCAQWPEGPQPTDDRVDLEREAMWEERS